MGARPRVGKFSPRMLNFRVIFKARYDVRAKDEEAAVREATVEILEEIAECGVRRFTVNVKRLD